MIVKEVWTTFHIPVIVREWELAVEDKGVSLFFLHEIANAKMESASINNFFLIFIALRMM